MIPASGLLPSGYRKESQRPSTRTSWLTVCSLSDPVKSTGDVCVGTSERLQVRVMLKMQTSHNLQYIALWDEGGETDTTPCLPTDYPTHLRLTASGGGQASAWPRMWQSLNLSNWCKSLLHCRVPCRCFSRGSWPLTVWLSKRFWFSKAAKVWTVSMSEKWISGDAAW